MFVFPPCFNVGDTIYFPFDTYDSNGASITITGLAITDIEVYKDGSVTQRSSDNGYVLLDTDGIDFDGSTGLHGFSIDTSDNSDAGFWVDGTQVWVHVNAVTVDTRTVRFTYYLPLGFALRPTTAGNTLDVTATGAAGIDWANIENKTTANDLSATDIQLSDTVTTLTGHTAQTADHTAAIADVPTVAEFNARTLVAASYFDPAADTVATVTTLTNLPAITSNWLTAAGLATDAVAEIADGVYDETLAGHTTADTAGLVLNELQDGGRLDLIFDATLLDTGTTLDDHLTDIKGTAFVKDTHSLIDIETYVDILDDGTSGNAKIATDVAATLVDTAVIGALGAGLTDLGGMSSTMKAQVQTEADASLVTIHLDHLLAVDYDPASQPGVSTALLNELIESNAGVSRFTTGALANAPTATGTGLTALASGTAQAGAGNQEIKFAASSTFADDIMIGNVVNLVTGTGAGQSRIITDYVQSTDLATVNRVWDTNPDGTTTYEVVWGASDAWLIEGIDATTQLAAALTVVSPTITLDGTNLAEAPTLLVPRNDDWSQQITTTVNATGWKNIWITAKSLADLSNDTDSTDSHFQLKAIASPSSSSLTFINKAAPAGGETGTLTISAANPLVLVATMDTTATKALVAKKVKYQIKWMDSASKVHRLSTIGNVLVEDTVTAAIT